MICVKDAAMNVVHISPEWHGFTGIEVVSALGRGWRAAIHADDRATVDRTLDEAARGRCGYSMDYRLLHRSGAMVWVTDGAIASFAPEDLNFLGVLGSITEMPPSAWPAVARGRTGEFHPPPPMPSTLTADNRDLMADHLLLARSMAERERESAIVEALDIVLYLTRKRLARPLH